MEYSEVNGTDLSSLHNEWNPQLRAYPRPSEGRVKIYGADYDYRIEAIDDLYPNDDPRGLRFATKARITRALRGNFNQPPDITDLEFLGWGHTTGYGDGDQLAEHVRVLRKAGYRNPQIIGVNTMGKATGAYMSRRDFISKTGLDDRLTDARAFARRFVEDGRLSGEVVLEAHSVGLWEALAFYDELLTLKEKALEGGDEDSESLREKTKFQISKVLLKMPASYLPGSFRSGQFIWKTKSQVPAGVGQFLTKRGNLMLDEATFKEVMMGGQDEENLHEHWSRIVPDSATAFLQFVFNIRDRFSEMIEKRGKDLEFHVLGENPQGAMLPKKTTDDLCDKLRDLGSRKVELTESSLPHSIPFKLTDSQKAELRGFYSKAYKIG